MCCFYTNLPTTSCGARELLIEENTTATADKLDSTLARWTYTPYFQFLRDKDVNNIIATCTLCAKPKDLSTLRNSTSNLTKHQEWCHTNIKLVTKRKQTEDESRERTKQQKHSLHLGCLNLKKWGDCQRYAATFNSGFSVFWKNCEQDPRPR